MTVDSRLDILPKFQIRAVSPGSDTTLVTGTFTRAECVATQDQGWLFVSETESSIADIVTLESNLAGLDVPNWSITHHLQESAVLPWLDSRWRARDLAFLLDGTKEWQRVEYEATDAVVFAKKTSRCIVCGWTGDVSGTPLQGCPKCSSKLKEVEIFGNQEAAFPVCAPGLRGLDDGRVEVGTILRRDGSADLRTARHGRVDSDVDGAEGMDLLRRDPSRAAFTTDDSWGVTFKFIDRSERFADLFKQACICLGLQET